MRVDELKKLCRKRRLDAVVVRNEANLKAFTGVTCDSAALVCAKCGETVFYTDFRYVPMVHRVAPSLKVRDIRRMTLSGNRIGFESSVSHATFLKMQKLSPRTRLVDVSADFSALRAIKTTAEIASLRAAEALDCRIWNDASRRFRAGMTEKDMARIIQKLMIDLGDGEAFSTIVCVGRNAAECHHKPDETVWDGKEPVLVDMGVRLGGVCSDLTRNLFPSPSRHYREIYAIVKRAHDAAIAAARPGMTARALDRIARDVIRKAGYGKAFGHSLGHGVGYEIHEAPAISRRGDMTLKPGMVFTIEPGIYLEGELGVRIEDLVLVTDSGCEMLSDP